MIQWALDKRFPGCVVLADSRYGVEPFVNGLRRLKLGYVVEIKSA